MTKTLLFAQLEERLSVSKLLGEPQMDELQIKVPSRQPANLIHASTAACLTKARTSLGKPTALDAGHTNEAAKSCLQNGNLHLFNTIQQINSV